LFNQFFGFNNSFELVLSNMFSIFVKNTGITLIKVGILGSRGIPNNYGGFEQFAEYLSVGLTLKGMDITVYTPHHHPYKKTSFNGVKLIHCYDPERLMGTSGQFIYDLNCILDSRKRSFDIIYQLGYTSSAIWQALMPEKSTLITNMDGIEWQRNKYSKLVRAFLRFSEKQAVKKSNYLIADSKAIQEYLQSNYLKDSTYLAYGAERFLEVEPGIIEKLDVQPFAYNLLIARLQADNNIETIIQSVLKSEAQFPLLVVGNFNNKYGSYLLKKYREDKIRFLGGIYNPKLLNNLRFHAALYIHGHSAGGTNPSLLEAMAASARICAHDNVFNKSILAKDALYFRDSESLTVILNQVDEEKQWGQKIQSNLRKIEETFNWPKIIDQYFELFTNICNNKDFSST
jgi:glycosyltransferase involved in cell wall biosynthesis